MSEHDETTGQFTSGEPLTGRAGVEAAVGYKPYVEEKEEPAEELTLREASDKIAQARTAESNIQTHVAGVKLPDNVSMTLDQAAKIRADGAEADNLQGEMDDADKLRAEVDELRNEGKDPAKEQAPEAEPDIEKLLAQPKVKEAITAQVGEAETQRQAYSSAVEEIGKVRVAALIADIPELASLPLDQWRGALAQMATQNPERYRTAAARIDALAQVEAAQQQLNQQKAAREKAEFQKYAANENERFKTLTKHIPAQEMAAIEAYVPKMLSAHGVDVKQFLDAVSNQSTFPRGVAEALLTKAAQFDLFMDRLANTKKAAAAAPPVQRPGARPPPGTAAATSVSALKTKFQASGSLKDGAALIAARRAAAKRA